MDRWHPRTDPTFDINLKLRRKISASGPERQGWQKWSSSLCKQPGVPESQGWQSPTCCNGWFNRGLWSWCKKGPVSKHLLSSIHLSQPPTRNLNSWVVDAVKKPSHMIFVRIKPGGLRIHRRMQRGWNSCPLRSKLLGKNFQEATLELLWSCSSESE